MDNYSDVMFFNKKNILIIFFLMLLCLVLTKLNINESNDTFYLIKLGELISNNGIDMKDHFSWIGNLSYTYPHWLYSVIIYYFYHFFSFKGVFLLNYISYSLIISIIYYVNIKINKNTFIAFLVAFISVFAFKPFILPRSIIFSTIIFLLEIYFIHQLIQKAQKRYIFFLFLLSVLLANIHASSWIMFFILFIPFLMNAFVFKIKKKKWNIEENVEISQINNIKLVIIAFILSLFAGFFSPSRVCYTYIFRIMLGNTQNYISEHEPLVVIRYPIVLIMLFFLYFSKVKIKMFELFMILGISIMTFSSNRHIIFFYAIVFLYLSIILMRNIHSNKRNYFTISFLEKIFINKKIMMILSVIILSIAIFFVKNNMNEELKNDIYPIEAVKYLKTNYSDKKLFNEYNDGSYLLFNDIKVFIDSRCDLYLKEFNNINVLDDYLEMYYKRYEYDMLFEKYDVEVILLPKNGITNKIIKNDLKYRLAYDDSNFVIYERVNKDDAV